MRTTIDIPTDVYRRAKAEAAMRGIKLKEMVISSLTRELQRRSSIETGSEATQNAENFFKGLNELATSSGSLSGNALSILLENRKSEVK